MASRAEVFRDTMYRAVECTLRSLDTGDRHVPLSCGVQDGQPCIMSLHDYDPVGHVLRVD
jgi:hypothetical protein